MKEMVIHNDLPSLVKDIFKHCGNHLKLAAPLGLGKPNRLLNAIYQQVKAHPNDFQLTIYTALSLQVPQASAELEERFLQPFVERHFGAHYPHLDYAIDRDAGCLPDNIVIHEFYFSSGSQLHNPSAQQHYISQNYTHVARDLAGSGVNLVVQQVARRGNQLSLSSNPDVILDLIDTMQQKNQPLLVVGVVNPELPYLGGDAQVDLATFDRLLDDTITEPLFAVPRESVSLADHAIGLHASTLVKDGGTLQIGIGALADAIVNALILRQQNNLQYQQALSLLGNHVTQALITEWGGLKPFEAGLYGATEMVMDGFMHLRQAGILRREVFDDIVLQQLLNQQKISNPLKEIDLQQLLDHGLISTELSEVDIAWLKNFGLIEQATKLIENKILIDTLQFSDGEKIAVNLNRKENFQALARRISGRSLTNGRYLEGAFYLGSKNLYQWFKQLDDVDWKGLWMRRVSHINELLGGSETLDRMQRKDARFFNTCMMHTLTGAAISDGLDDGRVVSGVGGQYNFVSMAHALDDGRSILLLRSTRTTKGVTESNIRWNYGHITIPRHLRDIVITEYGIADLRGQSDQEVIKRMLSISDARFQNQLLAKAKAAGKIDPAFTIPELWQNNLPERLEGLAEIEACNAYPFGSDFDSTEQRLIKALTSLKLATSTPTGKFLTLLQCMLPLKRHYEMDRCLERMGLLNAKTIDAKILARMLMRYL